MTGTGVRVREPSSAHSSRERIVAEAVLLLYADGFESLSMRRLGTRLGAGATSLLRHAAIKDELVELVVNVDYGNSKSPTEADFGVRSPVSGHAGPVRLGANVMRCVAAGSAAYLSMTAGQRSERKFRMERRGMRGTRGGAPNRSAGATRFFDSNAAFTS
ncbi:TetR/AcrR family transcriptional regulator [Streptomyces candidus]|uniref:AcrR family transcriptional regulator n=1 Tax=Streptomyces candidus TaxID=67283 RepID=A0A7X0LRW4_9ACTN|nr:TetR family transcriptional regulator [Streptomyces candidus]MBB6437401.1 AcrR family transcriptional regulator [Streptomyces candidus]GHH38873.1 hypothetical protein GCM10018773_17760 [Streptomyces candidus]